MNEGIELKPIPMYIDNIREQINEISNLINEFQYSINKLNGAQPEVSSSDKASMKDCPWDDKSICDKLSCVELQSADTATKARAALSRLNKLF
jgi:hypothetical protein